jgi:hypothetical protein
MIVLTHFSLTSNVSDHRRIEADPSTKDPPGNENGTRHGAEIAEYISDSIRFSVTGSGASSLLRDENREEGSK